MKNSMLSLVIILVLSSACAPSGVGGSEATSTPEADHTATAEAISAGKTQFAIDAQETVYMRSSATAEVKRTATKAAEVTQEEERRATRQTATAEVIAESTNQAQPMADLVEELYESGYISSTDGVFYSIDDFSESWAKIGWHRWWRTDYSPTNFIVRADVSWDSASDVANWYQSGCGFIFREDGKGGDRYRVYLGLDGYAYMSGKIDDIFRNLGRSYYGKVGVPSGNAELMLIVEGSQFTFFVNGKRVHSNQDQKLKSGYLALTLVSGTNKGFGIRCRMTNIGLWHLQEAPQDNQ